ncbi:MAG: DUF167 domain-containing protein [Actinobacteria bacterium]|nr:DUF167 domain-containing protein [Actinomycetota bacterium]
MQFTVRVKPGSSKGPLVDASGEEILVYVTQRAAEGAANAGVSKALAAHFGVAPSRVRIVRGHTARIKRVEVDE